jgi:hypothetical protein
MAVGSVSVQVVILSQAATGFTTGPTSGPRAPQRVSTPGGLPMPGARRRRATRRSSARSAVDRVKPALRRNPLALRRRAFYSAAIDRPDARPKEPDMTHTTLTQRLASIAAAAVLTLGMLFSVNGLATSEVSPQLLARVSLSTHA